MKIQSKTFLKFQIAVAIVTAILMPIYWYVFCICTGKGAPTLFDSSIGGIILTIIYAIILFPLWKLWKGKTWYSLSVLFFLTITIIAVICFVISIIDTIIDTRDIDTREWGFSIFWGVIILYVICAPVNLIIACLIGLIGKYFSTKHHSGIY